jgi:hypothetical protein
VPANNVVSCQISRQISVVVLAPRFQLTLRLCLSIGNLEMLYLLIIFLLHVVAVVTSSNSCLIQTCSASQGGGIVATIYDTSVPYAGGANDSDEVANVLTMNCGSSPKITQCYVDCNGIYGETGAYWTTQNCRSQCASITSPCDGYAAWFCSTSISNACQLAAPSAPSSTTTTNSQGEPVTVPTQSRWLFSWMRHHGHDDSLSHSSREWRGEWRVE